MSHQRYSRPRKRVNSQRILPHNHKLSRRSIWLNFTVARGCLNRRLKCWIYYSPWMRIRIGLPKQEAKLSKRWVKPLKKRLRQSWLSPLLNLRFPPILPQSHQFLRSRKSYQWNPISLQQILPMMWNLKLPKQTQLKMVNMKISE